MNNYKKENQSRKRTFRNWQAAKKNLDEIIKKLLEQRSELSERIEKLEGTTFSKSRDTYLKDILSLDRLLLELLKNENL